MIFKTENSTYEVNLDTLQIRRTTGTNKPTDRQGDDGQWKTYQSITVPMVGARVLIIWYTETEHKPGLVNGIQVDDVFGVDRSTVTSEVTSIVAP